MVNINKLKGKIVENGSNMTMLAEAMGMNRGTLYRKIANEGRDFTINDVTAIKDALNLETEDTVAIFFAQ